MDTGVGSKAESDRRENPALNHGTRPVLLIVDDEPLGLKSMASVFEGQGYELVLTGSGHEAMQFVETGRPDVILLDVMMPGMDGLEACRRIRSHPGMAEIPILLVTALDDRQSRLEGLESGADDYITKPIDRAEVRARVRTITRLNRFRRLQEEIVYSRQTMAELREYSRRLDLLRRIDRAILMADSAAEIAGQVLPLLRDLIPHSHAAIYRQEPRGQSYSPSWPRTERASRWRSWKTSSRSVTWAWHSRSAPRASVLSFSGSDEARSCPSCPGSFMPRE